MHTAARESTTCSTKFQRILIQKDKPTQICSVKPSRKGKMEGAQVNVLLRQSWNNLIDLPSNLVSLLYNANVSPQEVIVELVLLTTQARSYLGWSGVVSKGPKLVGLDPIFAHSLKLADKQSVSLNLKIRNPKATKIFLEPVQASDWELVELHASYIESKLIEQSRCVALHQTLVVYPTKTSSVSLLVKDIGIESETYALIDPHAEICIAPKARKQNKSSASRSLKSARSQKSSSDDNSHNVFALCRGIAMPSPLFASTLSSNEKGSYAIYANMADLPKQYSTLTYVAITVLPGPGSKTNFPNPELAKEDDLSKDGVGSKLSEAKDVIARLIAFDEAPDRTVGLSRNLAIALNAENKVGFRVVLRAPSKAPLKKVKTITLHPYAVPNRKATNLKFGSDLSQGSKISERISDALLRLLRLDQSPITNNCLFPPIEPHLPFGGILKFSKSDLSQVWMSPYNSSVFPKFEIGKEISRSEISSHTAKSSTGSLLGMDKLLLEIANDVTHTENRGILIHGSAGSGKTSVLHWLEEHLQAQYGMFCALVLCETMMNENSDQLCLQITKWIQECLWHEPAVLLLDNLDKLLNEGSENTDNTVSNQASEFLVAQFQKLRAQAGSNITIIATGLRKEAFNRILTQSHLLEDFHHLKVPGKQTRLTLVNNFLDRKCECDSTLDLMDIVLETEGYLANDIKTLCDKIICEALKANDGLENYKVKKMHVSAALQNFSPSNLRGVKLERSSVNWGDIGGLGTAKKILLETLEWPTKYGPIFANCPLRLRSGILLYGYPGCGKTLLASAVASQCGLNFISIKGPEILNKYIGASEQSVRELFDRAQSAKPCILFFDEFDSIAPKRGHDSTGVTDRVVNQMLTQMDGAEGLDGVYVLAATSRPDLIDSALLRPGRLDKSIICDLPSLDDRLSILVCICEKMVLHKNVQLEEIARQTGGYSGADLQGLCYNAYLQAVHEKLLADENVSSTEAEVSSQSFDFFELSPGHSHSSKTDLQRRKVSLRQQIEDIYKPMEDAASTEPNASNTKQPVVIKQLHLVNSLAETKPSISASEQAKLNKVYSEFLTGRDGNMPNGSASNEIGGRSLLM